MNNKYIYYDEAVKYYKKLSSNKLYKIYKKLFFSTHLHGPHLNFYHEPFGLHKNTPVRNFKKFQKSILQSISKITHCEKYGLFLNIYVVNNMIDQINNILAEKPSYWENYNFDTHTITHIQKVYTMYKLFLELYSNKIPTKQSKNHELLYAMSLKINLSINITPSDLQQLGIYQAKKIIKLLESLHNDIFSNIFDKYKTLGNYIETESELLSSTMNHILSLYDFCTHNFPSDIHIPEPHTIKLKWIPFLKSKWSSKGKVSGRYFFLNKHLLSSYKKEQLLKLCIHESIPGHITFRENTNKIIGTYLSSLHKKPKQSVKKLLKNGTKSVNEGFASYIEKIMINNNLIKNENILDVKTYFYFNKLFHALRIILDTGLNSQNTNIKFTPEKATEMLKSYTFLSDAGINAEINRYYANPGQACSYCFGNLCYDVLEKIYLKNNFTLSDFYSDMYKLQLPIELIFKYVKNKMNLKL